MTINETNDGGENRGSGTTKKKKRLCAEFENGAGCSAAKRMTVDVASSPQVEREERKRGGEKRNVINFGKGGGGSRSSGRWRSLESPREKSRP